MGSLKVMPQERLWVRHYWTGSLPSSRRRLRKQLHVTGASHVAAIVLDKVDFFMVTTAICFHTKSGRHAMYMDVYCAIVRDGCSKHLLQQFIGAAQEYFYEAKLRYSCGGA